MAKKKKVKNPRYRGKYQPKVASGLSRKTRRAAKRGNNAQVGYAAARSSARKKAFAAKGGTERSPFKNPPMKRVTKSTGWMSATAVKIVKRRGGDQVLIRKPRKKSKGR